MTGSGDWVRLQRRAFIAKRLELQGYINKADLIEQFGLSTARASNGLQDFLKLYPTAMHYDASAKRYVADAGLRTACAALADVSPSPEVAALKAALSAAWADVARLRAMIQTPQIEDFGRGVALEAAHQVERWGADHDAGKSPFDWFWLLGFLAQKAAAAAVAGDLATAKHHTISTAAACLNWHRHLSGASTAMRPGIATPAGEVAHG